MIWADKLNFTIIVAYFFFWKRSKPLEFIHLEGPKKMEFFSIWKILGACQGLVPKFELIRGPAWLIIILIYKTSRQKTRRFITFSWMFRRNKTGNLKVHICILYVCNGRKCEFKQQFSHKHTFGTIWTKNSPAVYPEIRLRESKERFGQPHQNKLSIKGFSPPTKIHSNIH